MKHVLRLIEYVGTPEWVDLQLQNVGIGPDGPSKFSPRTWPEGCTIREVSRCEKPAQVTEDANV